MPDWGTVLGSGYDAFFDRKDKNREFQLRKQQEDALNTLRQIQIDAALREAEKDKAFREMTTPQFQKYAEGDKLTPLGINRLGGMMGGITQNLEGWNPTQLKELGIQQENPEYAPALATNTQKLREQGGETVMPNISLDKILPLLDRKDAAELMISAPGKNIEQQLKLAQLNKLKNGEWEIKTEERYDPGTHVTFGRTFYYNKDTRQKTYEPEGWRPIKGRESTSVTIGFPQGKPPSGFRWLPDGNLEPIPGGPGEKKLPAAASAKFGSYGTLLSSIKAATKLYNDKYVGPVAGRYYSIAENLTNLPVDQVQFYAYVNDMKDALLRARSGAQINEQEYKRLVKFLPTSELPPENFMARMQRFKQQVEMMMASDTKVYRDQGYHFGDEGKKTERTIVEQRKTKDGRILTKYSDGSIE
jgi:hypothetical protein